MKKTFKKYFIPHVENDHKPHFLREKNVLVMSALIVFLFGFSLVGRYVVTHNKHLASIQAAFLVDLANEDRKDSGLTQLKINDKLVLAANLKAQDMSNKGYFAHVSPDGKTPWYFIDQAGYSYLYAGENLAVNFYDSEDVQDAWMDSPTHKANILGKNFTEIGIATSNGRYKGDNTTFVVQMFASPKKVIKEVPRAQSVNNIEENTQNIEIAEEGTEDTNVLGAEIETETLNNNEIVEVSGEGSFAFYSDAQLDNEDIVNDSTASSFEGEEAYTNWFERIIVSPGVVLDGFYKALAAIVIFALILKIFIEIRLQHPKNIAYGVILLILIIGFMHVNTIIQESIVVVSI